MGGFRGEVKIGDKRLRRTTKVSPRGLCHPSPHLPFHPFAPFIQPPYGVEISKLGGGEGIGQEIEEGKGRSAEPLALTWLERAMQRVEAGQAPKRSV